MDSDPVGQLAAALSATERLVAGVREEQWEGPTPCTEWTVRELVSHLATGNGRFAAIVAGRSVPAGQPEPMSGDGLLGAYRDSASALLEAFAGPGVLDRLVNAPIGPVPGAVALHLRITEALVHGWDLARSTDQAADFPDDLAEQELAFSRAKVTDLPPGRRPFAEPRPAADDAPAIDRLVAFLGRDLSWQAHS